MASQLLSESVALLRDMVRIPSESFSEDAVCALLEERLASWGVSCRRYGRNIVALNRNFDPSLPTLALDAHIDTVPAAVSWTREPLDPGDDPETVYGLGSNDDGGSVVAMTAAFRHFYAAALPANLALVLSCEEERSGPDGARFLYSSDGPEELAGVRWVILGEPTGMKAATSERGLLVLDAISEGVTGHAARGNGVNALYKAIADIETLRAHRFTKISPTMGEVRLSVTQIQAGTAHNVIPDKCSFVVDIRPTEQYSNEEILSELQALCSSTLKARNLTNRSSATPASSLLLKTAGDLGIETFPSPTTSNWMRIGQREGIKMGPGESTRSHKADEFILVSEIDGAVSQYISFIEKFYGNTLEQGNSGR